MANVDIEVICSDIETFLKDNLNTKIRAINTEKADDIELKEIEESAYFFQTMDDRVANYDPFIYYGIADVESISSGPSTIKDYSLDVVICFMDPNEITNVGKRLLRYSRVLEELFEKNFDKIRAGFKFSVKTLTPISFSLVNSSRPYRAIGVDLGIQLG